MENLIYNCPTKLVFGNDQLITLGKEIKLYGSKILLTYGKDHIKDSGLYDQIITILKEADIEWYELPGIVPNPRLETVQQGIHLCRNENIEFILAIGGGSVSDTAKAISMGVKVDYNIWEAYKYFHSNLLHQSKSQPAEVCIPKEALPIGVVMTKAGTGSEFDLTSVITKPDTQEKLIIMNPIIYPKFSYCDPTLTYTLPQEETVFGIADMMTHYFEQYFSPTHNTEFLDNVKEGILRAIINNARKILGNPTSYNVRADLMYSAAWSCSSLNITGVTPEWTSHFIEHEITALTDLNHGCGMAIVYPAWMQYVVYEHSEKFAQYAEKVWGIERIGRSEIDVAMEGIRKTREFWSNLGIPPSLSEVGVDSSMFPAIAKKAVRFGPLGSLKIVNESDVLNILDLCK